MPLEKRSFMGGMNKDVDVRLIKNPDYIDALNVRAATSVDGTIGSLENIEGNVEVPFDFYSTDPETFFVNDNGLYEEINPSTVFYQKVIRIQGWEQTNQAYNFSLFSVGPNGNVLIGEFNWNGNIGHTFTSSYLNSQFSSVGPFNSGINVYDINTGNQFTASVKLLSFGQNSVLHGGYFDIVIECDVAGVNFDLSISSNVDSDNLIYTYGEQGVGVPISVSENLSAFLLPGFDTGGVFNTDTNDDGVVVSPDGTLYEVGNRTVWRITFIGEEPTSPTSFDEVTIFSYRENMNPADETFEFEFEPFLTINQGTFSSGEFQFDSNQNNLAAFLHDQFSESKSVLCDGLPLNFNIDPEKFFLTFSENATFDSNNNFFSIVVVGPVGVKFKLALLDSSENLMVALQPGNEFTDGETDFATIFGNGTFMTLNNYQIVDNSIEITNSIVDSYDTLQLELENQIQQYYYLDQQLSALNVQNNNLQQQLTNQIELTATANQELADTEANLALANQALSSANSTISSLGQANDNLQEQNDAMLIEIATLNEDLDSLSNQLNDIQSQLNIAQGNLADEQVLTAEQVVTIASLNEDLVAARDAILALNVVHADQLASLQAELGGEISGLQTANENLETLLNSTNQMVAQYLLDMEDQDNAHAAAIAQLTSDHEEAVDDLISQHEQALADAESADQAAQDALQAQFDEDLAALTAQHNDAVQALDFQITSLSTQVSDQSNTITNLQSSVGELVNTVFDLQEQLEELRISDAIIVAKLNEYEGFYQSIKNAYNSSLILFDALSLSNQIIYEEDFSSSSDFSNEWLFYEDLFDDSITSISSYNNGVISNPSGYEQNGYLKLHTNVNSYTAARLPYSSFQASGGWQHGSEVVIQMNFEVVSTVEFMSLPSGFNIRITNMWDESNEFDYADTFYIPYTLTLAGGQNNNIGFSHSFTVNDPNNEYINEKSNVTIVIPPVADHVEIRLTNIRVGNDSQEMFSFNLNNLVPEAEENYLNMYNDVNTVVLDWQNSGLDSLEEFIGTSSFGLTYQQILDTTIRGYLEGINSNSTIGGRLQAYADAVFSFNSSVQQQIYNQYLLYALASTVDISALEAQQEQYQFHVDLLRSELDYRQNQIEGLEFQLGNAMDTIEIYAGMSHNPILDNLLIGENVVSGIFSIVGPEPGLISEWSSPPYLFALNGDLGIRPKWRINGEDVFGDTIVILTYQEVTQLFNEPHSATNNICTYITNRYSNNQAIEFEIPGGNYPTQVMHIIFGNFDENTTEFGPEMKPTITAGVEWTSDTYQAAAAPNVISQKVDFFQISALQILFYFNEQEADNITFSDEIYLNRFQENQDGAVLWVGDRPQAPYYMVKAVDHMINYADESGAIIV
tara:strand:+ start:75 stop:4190 length:4116 start_codon:yes stop_codon:yes gene_type:complete